MVCFVSRKSDEPKPTSPMSGRGTAQELLHSSHCGYTSLEHNGKVHHSVDELELGHLHVLIRHGLLELVADDNRDIHNQEIHPPPPPQVHLKSSAADTPNSIRPRRRPGRMQQLTSHHRSVQGGVRGGVGHSPQGGDTRRTSPQSNPKVTHHRTGHAAPENSWLAPSFTKRP